MAESASPLDPSFSGIDFNPAFFPSAAGAYVDFPTAQGTVTFGQIYATDIDTPTPSVDFDLRETGNINFGTSVPATKTIEIGASTGTSIHCGSIDLKGTNINNAVDASAGVISLAPAQTSGILNIGTGSRTSGGTINIETAASGYIAVNVGTSAVTETYLNGTGVYVPTKLITPLINTNGTSTGLEIGANLNEGDLSLASAQSTGTLNIGTGSRNTPGGGINIGTGSSSANLVTFGSGTSSTILNGTSVQATTKLTTPRIDSLSNSATIVIGNNQTTGLITSVRRIHAHQEI